MRLRRRVGISGGKARKDERLISLYDLIRIVHISLNVCICAYRHRYISDVYDIVCFS